MESCRTHCQIFKRTWDRHRGLWWSDTSCAGPVDSVLFPIRERLEKTRGEKVSSGQVLSKWILHKGAIIVTWVLLLSLFLYTAEIKLVCVQHNFQRSADKRVLGHNQRA
jgi:hypothetical protein